MEYKIYKMIFQQGVHFGNHSLEKSEPTFQADTLFSSLYIEAMKFGQADILLDSVINNRLVISDAFPYIGNNYFIPKPMKKIEQDSNNDDITARKKFKKLEYIQVALLDDYLKGEYPIDNQDSTIKELGAHSVKTSVSIRGEEEAKPYRVGIYHFKEHNGLYVIVGYESEKELELFDKLFDSLSLSGIGGKKNSGLGHFRVIQTDVPTELVNRLNSNGECMTLSCSLPKESEIESVLESSRYLLEKRSGFVDSDSYASEQRRKKDIYMFKSGSCFNHKFTGDIYDVSSGGKHPVYKYAKPLFMGVEV